jgi:hypothetical protein
MALRCWFASPARFPTQAALAQAREQGAFTPDA